tara:strand:- start:152 stop:379 length:228 start_codon:yes stop_codon:yes gene_type:complete
MKILFLGDVVGLSGCKKITSDLLNQIKKNNIDFVIINGENADDTGVGLTKEICKDFFDMELMLLQLETTFGIKKI